MQVLKITFGKNKKIGVSKDYCLMPIEWDEVYDVFGKKLIMDFGSSYLEEEYEYEGERNNTTTIKEINIENIDIHSLTRTEIFKLIEESAPVEFFDYFDYLFSNFTDNNGKVEVDKIAEDELVDEYNLEKIKKRFYFYDVHESLIKQLKNKYIQKISYEEFYGKIILPMKEPSDIGLWFKDYYKDNSHPDTLGNNWICQYETLPIIIGDVLVHPLMGDTHDNSGEIFEMPKAVKLLERFSHYLKKENNTDNIELELKFETWGVMDFWLTANYKYSVKINGSLIVKNKLLLPDKPLDEFIEQYNQDIKDYKVYLKRIEGINLK